MVGKDYGIDVDIIMQWPVSKLYRYMAFYKTETPGFIESVNKKPMTEQALIDALGGWDED